MGFPMIQKTFTGKHNQQNNFQSSKREKYNHTQWPALHFCNKNGPIDVGCAHQNSQNSSFGCI